MVGCQFNPHSFNAIFMRVSKKVNKKETGNRRVYV